MAISLFHSPMRTVFSGYYMVASYLQLCLYIWQLHVYKEKITAVLRAGLHWQAWLSGAHCGWTPSVWPLWSLLCGVSFFFFNHNRQYVSRRWIASLLVEIANIQTSFSVSWRKHAPSMEMIVHLDTWKIPPPPSPLPPSPPKKSFSCSNESCLFHPLWSVVRQQVPLCLPQREDSSLGKTWRRVAARLIQSTEGVWLQLPLHFPRQRHFFAAGLLHIWQEPTCCCSPSLPQTTMTSVWGRHEQGRGSICRLECLFAPSQEVFQYICSSRSQYLPMLSETGTYKFVPTFGRHLSLVPASLLAPLKFCDYLIY